MRKVSSWWKYISIPLLLSMASLAEAPAPPPLSAEQKIEVYRAVLAAQAAKNAALEAQFRLMQANEKMTATLAKYRHEGWRLNDELNWEKEK